MGSRFSLTREVATVSTQQRIRVLWSSAPPLLAAGFDDAEPQLQPGDVVPTTHATSAAKPGVYQRPLFKGRKTATLVRLRESSDLLP
ncbi:hypothetical protein T07_5765 [Trichinella nelsoni]|uniref:Uncharacterized protein n=1 Tax=Trichinella nelsoni TaxID=6336 RepID=A0A0V0RF27_9BILA|nr:hypothetical protein T07_5765 [Trichinella nelsoni]